MRKLLLLLVLILSASVVNAQNAGTTHVFPQIADGRLIDGSSYTSRFWITNISGSTVTCTISLFGITTDRLLSSPTVTLQSGAWATVLTRGQDVIATGYARVDCSQAVFASLTYSLRSATDIPLGIATILSSPVASYAAIPMVLNGNYRYGIAIANNNDAALVVSFIFNSAGPSGGQTIQIPARSQYAKFIDEIFSVPSQGSGTFEISANGTVGSGNFNVTGLIFDRGTFTTLVPATNR